MSFCLICGQKKSSARGCLVHEIIINGQECKRIKYGDEKHRKFVLQTDRCPDCYTLTGHSHHYGCEIEECPVCGGQLRKCGCTCKSFVELIV